MGRAAAVSRKKGPLARPLAWLYGWPGVAPAAPAGDGRQKNRYSAPSRNERPRGSVTRGSQLLPEPVLVS